MKWLFSLLIVVVLLVACGPQTSPLTDSPTPTVLSQQMLPLQESGDGAAPTASPLPTPTAANADVQFVQAELKADGTWTFHVTVLHPDTGWDDYADGWDVVLPDGSVLKSVVTDPYTRVLLHPHENEQPFTRAQGGLVIPEGVEQVTVRAHDMVDGWGGKVVVVDLSQANGPDFEILR